jgi:hypothetical protein
MNIIREQDFFIIRKAQMQFTPIKAQEFYAEHRGLLFAVL